ncbi:MAG: hypothetical protein AAF657_35900 [Acidobacteriota bacterium]
MLAAPFGNAFLPPGAADLELARQSTRQAVALDPASPNALTVHAAIQMFLDWDLASAEQLLQRCIQIAPSFVRPQHFYSTLLLAQGRFVEAEMQSREAAAAI